MEAQRRQTVVLMPGAGRKYSMGRINAVFKADGEETDSRYNISEWWLDPHTQGPGAHSHTEDDVFYVLEGCMSFFVDGHWMDAKPGTFVLVPGGVSHDFANRSDEPAGMLNMGSPGGFEDQMPAIAEWFAAHPPGDA